ncbi:formylglycine-generating enzyme family protein [Leptolyngbya sp. CCY15150]|uniref:formylglycine-generating enzyme family protein n=1 Tax=Leptolyngbya sp. CCY15150 TaxID=2767772 RepID=UPI001EF1C564|nr:formylglycine-generating enzyme family protein [Leptolyngbya sp. CCY15150]
MPESSTPSRRLILRETTHQGQCFIEHLDDNTTLDMMLIPGGQFLMGSTPEDPGSYEREYPQHPVKIQPFAMARTPMTQEQWRVVAGYDRVDRDLTPDPSGFKGANRPVEQVSWDDAQEFCARLSRQTNRTYRLPSEAEWEYACRAGTTTPFHFGETLSDELANYRAKEIFGRGIPGEYRDQTTDVKTFPPNAFGLYDMHGNVLEWCEDDWYGSYNEAPNDGSAQVNKSEDNKIKVLRGGSWVFIPRDCRSAYRYGDSRDTRHNYAFGFRVCCVLPSILLD